MKKEYVLKIPEIGHKLPLSRERSINARLKNLVNWEKESLKATKGKINNDEKG